MGGFFYGKNVQTEGTGLGMALVKGFTELLKTLGLEVDWAENGSLDVEKFEASRLDLVTLPENPDAYDEIHLDCASPPSTTI